MTVSPFDSTLYGELLSDEESAAVFSDEAEIAALLAVEAALARVQARLGIVPEQAAARIAETVESAQIAPADLAAGTGSAGVPLPALVAALRDAAGKEAGAWAHWGATSQDIADTALIVRLRDVLALHDRRLANLSARLCELAEEHRRTVMVARTRAQQATPTSFGLKAAGWLAPLVRHRHRLAQFKPRLLAVQFGGAAGTLSVLEGRGVEVMQALAAELDLVAPSAPWHNQRDTLAELAGWFALVTGSLGKIGEDLVLLAQSEIAEVRAGPGGGSSTMPQKANPVASEVLVALARLNAGLLGTLHQSLPQAQERDGAGWTLEWLVLPQMAVAAGTALRHAVSSMQSLTVDAGRMRRNLDAGNGLVLAEAASFALAAHMSRPDAQSLVKAACVTARDQDLHLVDVLRATCDAPVDWEALADPARHLGSADALIDRVVSEARALV